METLSLHKAFDMQFKSAESSADDGRKARLLNEINIDLHVSSQMILLYPDIDSENAIKSSVASFSRLASKLSKIDSFKFFLP